MPLKACYVIKIYLPIEMKEIGDELLQSRKPLYTRSPYLSAILHEIAATEGVGLLGNYDQLCELTEGEEWFTPQVGANPTIGRIGERCGVEVIVVTTYAVGLDRTQVEAFVERLVSAHEYEHPVIECFGPEGPLLWTPE